MAVLLSVLMGLVVPLLPGLLRRLLSLCCALFEPGGDRLFPVRVIRGRRQLIVPDLLSGQGLFINDLAPGVYLPPGNGPPPVVLIVDNFHQRIAEYDLYLHSIIHIFRLVFFGYIKYNRNVD